MIRPAGIGRIKSKVLIKISAHLSGLVNIIADTFDPHNPWKFQKL
jgi:hypothetical protein